MSSILKPIAHINDALSQQKRQLYFTTCCCLVLPYCLHKTLRPLQIWRKWKFRKRLETIDQDRKNILRIEGDLRRSKKIFVHAINDRGETAPRLLDTLTDIWRRTHLVEHRVIIQAEWFIQHFQPDSPDQSGFIDWAASMKSLGHILMLWIGSFSPGLKNLSSSVAIQGTRTVVVINNVNSLYPERLLLKDYHLQAQQRFADWVDKHFKSNETVSDDTISQNPP
ncbi:uncharacterized protein LY89DRAFT_679442 [Mollisia scopiformis]|uniref:Uncharacterized protein n=1 Tax=Mollisia scopiformis TaxID=149040 RepID=A0A194XVA7_MOLSC|nr:uncharacterized protein LY89DRAFT_679442 [Mollisia scopiformis]KUJ24265.1 hypothetical protein LY89DRAFT_679442 [Mollisia scopiformis]